MYYAGEIVRAKLLPFSAALVLTITGCSSPPPSGPNKQAGPPISTSVVAAGHPMAKYLEVVGFRLAESGAGKLAVKFAIVNHSEADIGDLGLKVKLSTTAAKPEDPPITEFDVKVPSLGPQELKDVSATGTTKLRIYELPDWQFIRANVEITSPAQ
jgi:hypothetical protein